MNFIIGCSLIVVSAALGLVWFRTGRRRPNGRRYAAVPATFGWFTLVLALAAFNWPLIQSGPLGGSLAWVLIAVMVIAGLLIAWNQTHAVAAVGIILVVAALALGPIASAAVAATGLVNGPGAPSTTSASPSPTATAEPTTPPTAQVQTSPADVPAVYPQRYLDLLTEHEYKLETVEGQTLPVFVAKSTMYDKKLWTDAVCLPVGDREAVLAMVLGSPDCAAQVASGLFRLPVIGLNGKTQQLGEISPWLSEFKDPAQLNDWAQAAMASEGAERVEYARKLVLIAIQLERFSDGGVEKRETAYNFHAVVNGPGGTLSVDEANPWDTIPEFELNPKQYRSDFVIFRVTYKGFDGCWSEFGINVGDGRFAGFTCEKPKPTETPKPTPSTEKPKPEPTKPGPGPSKTPKPTPSKTPTPEPTPTPTPTPTPSIDKPDEKNPTPPPAVTPTTQPDPVESTPPPKPKDPVKPTEKPGDPIPPKEDKPDKPAVPVPDNEDHPKPADPPKEDKPNNPPPDKPGDEIEDPDAPPAGALLIPLAPMVWGVLRRLRRAA